MADTALDKLRNAYTSGALNNAIAQVGNATGSAIAAGRESGVGNAIATGGNFIGDIVSKVPILGKAGAGLVKGISGLVGGAVNAAFGNKIDEQAVAGIRGEAEQLNNKQFDASNTADLLTNANFDMLGVVNKNDIGKEGWFSNKVTNLAKELTTGNMYANNNATIKYMDSVDKVDYNNDFAALKNQTAFGGPLMMRYSGPMSPFGKRFDTGGNIYIKPSKRGTFTAAAKEHGKSVQAFASQVLANKDNYSPAMVKKANFARNAAKWHATGGPLEDFINNINSRSKANFVQRLKDPNRASIRDWSSNNIATHKLSWATDKDGNAIVFPDVQEINGKLYDFTDPKNKRGKWDAYDSAVERGDTLMMTPKQADMFTRTYKNYYPNFKANGGPLYTQGGVWDNGLTYINEGGTHEENPYEGVQVGVDPNGIPNTVEEGEVIFNDYVFSNRIKLDEKQKNYFKLGGKMKYSYADAAKKLTKEFEETPNDPISKNGRNAILQDLMMFQEEKRAKQQERKLARQFDKMSTEEKMGLMEMANQYAQQQNQEMQQPQEELQGIPYAKGGRLVNKFDKGGLEDPNSYILNPSLPDQKVPYSYYEGPTSPTNPQIAEGWKGFTTSTGVPLRTDKGYNPLYTDVRFQNFIRENWNELSKWWNKENAKDYFAAGNKEAPTVTQLLVGNSEQTDDKGNIIPSLGLMYDNKYGEAHRFGQYALDEYLKTLSSQVPTSTIKMGYNMELKPIPLDKVENKGIPTYDTSEMYAPLLGHAGTVSNTLFSKPDYSTANDLYSKAIKLGNINRVTTAPSGRYLKYDPTDVNRIISQLNANTAATRRGAIEMSLGNRAQAMRQLTGINNAYLSGLADTYAKSALENRGQLERVFSFNRDTDKFDSENALRAAMANQSAQTQANVAAFSGIEKAIAERNRIDAERSATLSAGLTGYFQTLHDIGKQKFIMNSINKNPGYRYYYDRNGGTNYKGQNE